MELNEFERNMIIDGLVLLHTWASQVVDSGPPETLRDTIAEFMDDVTKLSEKIMKE